MSNEVIHLVSGKTVLAEVNGKTLDGQRGYVLFAVDTGNLYRSLRESTEIEVEKRTDGKWWEISNCVAVKSPGANQLNKEKARKQ